MLTTIQGIYRGGRIELSEAPQDVREDTPVIVTFLAPAAIDLRARGMDERKAADVHASFSAVAGAQNIGKAGVAAQVSVDELEDDLPAYLRRVEAGEAFVIIKAGKPLAEIRPSLVTTPEEKPLVNIYETALLSEPALAQDWERPEEDAAWSHLQLAS